ncbi:MAG: CHRD domain-containing protein [Flavipsychrobacter sp.]
MKSFIQLATVAMTLLLTSQTATADHLTSKYLFAARMNGGQEVPAVTTNALGLATFYLNDTRDTMCVEMTATGLSGSITGIHIHEGEMGSNGAVVVDMMPYLSGNRLKGTITGSTLTQSFIAKMFAGKFYLNLHTAANANGEIRGQIVPEEDKAMTVMLNGMNEVPAVTTNARGIGVFMLQKHEGKLSIKVVVDGLSGTITGAHLHKGAAGTNGPVVENLTTMINGNTIMADVDPTAYLSDLKNGDIYLNVHTAANAGGEIRGQLMMQPYVQFDAMLDTAQETTAVTGMANGMGVASLRINYTFDTLWYDAQLNDLTGSIQAAHLHNGALGTSGGVVIGIPSGSINGNVISGMFTGADLSDSLMNYLLEGSIYLNVHTTANPAGEVRGQVYKTFREGYTYHINGAQEAPMVNSTASGTGMVSVDRDQTSAHYMMVVDNLTGFTAAHFHNNIAGQNGGVIYNLTPKYANGGIFGYWLDNEMTTPFTKGNSNQFRKDSVYVNIHTSANANGEVRGNTTRNLCNTIPTSTRTLGTISTVAKLYPNPTTNNAILDITLITPTTATISAVDMMGRKVWTATQNFTKGINRVNIPLNDAPTGVYFIQVTNKTGQMSFKLIKE